MSVLSNKRAIMTLYTNELCPYCHRVRIALAEKGIVADLIEVDLKDKPEELMSLNPYGAVPTLVDRDLVLYESRIIQEYLEERFPHPPLFSIYPIQRAQSRLLMERIDRDWYVLAGKIRRAEKEADAEKARAQLKQALLAVMPVFEAHQYFMSDEFTLVDCALAVLLWRLPLYGIDFEGHNIRPLDRYMRRVFKRESFQQSLTDAERAIRVEEFEEQEPVHG